MEVVAALTEGKRVLDMGMGDEGLGLGVRRRCGKEEQAMVERVEGCCWGLSAMEAMAVEGGWCSEATAMEEGRRKMA